MTSMLPLMLAASLLALAAPASAKACDQSPLMIENVRVFDGENVLPKATVVVRCARIALVAAGDEPFALPPSAVTLEGEGRTLMPGLIDVHTHTWSLPMLTRPLDFGVTTVMDMGSTNRTFAGKMRAERAKGPAQDRADMYSAVLWVTAPGSHGTQWGEVPTLVEPGDADEFVGARAAEGADFIKLIYDNFKMFDADIPTLSKETMEAVVDAAHDQGLMAVVHSRDVQAWEDVVAAGVDGIVHLPVDEVPGEELLNRIKAGNTWVSGNLSLSRALGESLIEDPAIGPMLSDSERENLSDFFAMHRPGGEQVAMDTVKLLRAAGITFLPGSDTPNGGTTYGATMHRDLETMVELGFSPQEALQAATRDAAAAFGLDDRGTIAEGMQADLLLVEGRPDQRITDTRNIVAVIKAGKLHPGPRLVAGP